MVFQLMGAIVFAIVLGTVNTLLMSSRLLHERVDRRLAELREFLREKAVAPDLRKVCSRIDRLRCVWN